MTPLDLLIFTGAVYGIAWILSKSHLLDPVRRLAGRIAFLRRLLGCIVCVSVWVAAALALLRGHPAVDLLFLVGWATATTRAIAGVFGDAD